MILSRKLSFILAVVLAAAVFAQEAGAPGSLARPVGTVKTVAGNTVTLTTDAGGQVAVTVPETARMVRTAPGQKDLTGATPIALPELQAGDRMLVRGKVSDDGKSVVASSAVIMKQTDVAERNKRELEQWQRHGTGGLVKAVDTATGTITLSTTATAGKAVAVHVSKETIIRRYAPDSVHFDDAKRGTLEEIKPGDQLRARGARSADGMEFKADEIVSGTFRNIAGTVQSVDAANGTMTVLDLATKKPVVVRITGDSQMRKLPAMVAQFIAMRLRGTGPEGPIASGAEGGSGARPEARPAGAASGRPQASGGAPGERRFGGEGGGPRPNGGGDIQQMLNRMPGVTLAELQKNDALMIVATQGSGNSAVTALTLLSGVEPILTAPNAAATLLSPWNLSSGAGDAAQ